MDRHDLSSTQAIPERRYPIFLSLTGKRCIVVGGGHVAARKVRSLLSAGAQVTVISPMLHDALQKLHAQEHIAYIPAEYVAEHLDGASLVFAATDNAEVNRQVARDAQQRGLWVNVADNQHMSDFYVPAVIRRQDLTLAISTEGVAPAFARYVREQLEEALTEVLGQVLTMVAHARPLIIAEPKERQEQLWASLFALHLETLIATEGYAAARACFETWLAHNMKHEAD